ncbi:MAG: amidohydrolase [Candidatus Bipolaricaulia bacterium]
MILFNGAFVFRPDADLLVVQDGRIAAIGPEASIAEEYLSDPDRMDLEGRAVLPGFVDAHVHVFNTGLTELGWRVDLSGLTREETLAALAASVADRGSREWVIGAGWDESGWSDQRYLSRKELDRISMSSAIGAVRMDGHLLIVNSEALRVVIETLPAGVDRALVDEETGQIREEAAWKVLQSVEPDEATLSDALTAAAKLCHRCGVTSVHAMTPRSRVSVLLKARGRDRLRVNVYQKVTAAEELEEVRTGDGFDGEWVRFGGVKAFGDGSLGAQNAAVRDPYADGGIGALNHSDESLERIVRGSDRSGWQTAIHAIGDRAIEQVLRVHASVGSSADCRHRVEHVELATLDQIERARDLGLHLSMQPNFIGNWSGSGSMNERRLGRARDEASNPLRRVLDSGAPLALGSDGMPVSPIFGIHSAANSAYELQRVTVEEAIGCYTEGGARFGFEEEVKGRLEVGALADLVVMDEDPRRAPDRVSERRIERVFVGGECVFASEED